MIEHALTAQPVKKSATMRMMGAIQWAISGAVLLFGIGLFGPMGTTAILYIGLGLLYCLVARVAMRGTILTVLISVLVDCLLAFASFKLLQNGLKAVPLNASMQGLSPRPADYVTLDTSAATVVLLLLLVYLAALVLNLRQVVRNGWL
jgi:hypothetical protein